MSPTEAGLDALKRMVRNYNNDMKKVDPNDLLHTSEGRRVGVRAANGGLRCMMGEKRNEKCAFLFEGKPLNWTPIPVTRKR